MKKALAAGILSASLLLGNALAYGKVAASPHQNSNAPTASSTIVISQAYGGGGSTSGTSGATYKNDFIELKNISSTPQSLNGLSLMYGSSTGNFASTATNAYALPNVTLQPGQYFLVQLGSVGTVGADLPVTADALTANLSMSGSSGKVALVTSSFTGNSCGATANPCALPTANIIDLVSYGAANNAEGGAPTNAGAALTASQGNVRKGNGCTDTDNNNADFDIVTAPVPHNSSTIAACSTGVPPVKRAPVDFNGDGKTDFAIVRNTDGIGVVGGQATWYINYNGSTNITGGPWGMQGDVWVPADYDGDGKTDIAVWRKNMAEPEFYILQSATNTFRAEQFGLPSDDPTVVGDYDGDGKADLAVYRPGPNPGDQSYWFYRGSLTPDVKFHTIWWGAGGDVPVPGDFDGDGKYDFTVMRGDSDGNGVYWTQLANGTIQPAIFFGYYTDFVVPGDYDGDGKTDIAIVRRSPDNSIEWWLRSSQTGAATGLIWGLADTDYPVQGDYDGDGKTDVAVWRESDTPGESGFWVLNSRDLSYSFTQWGQAFDYPVANFNMH